MVRWVAERKDRKSDLVMLRGVHFILAERRSYGILIL
jgi:hypothetical protein